MLNNNDRVTSNQIVTIIIMTLVGLGILSLPRGVVEKAGSDGWLLIILGGIMVIAVSYFITRLGGFFPGKTVVEYGETLLSMPIGILFSLGFAAYFFIFCAFEVRIFAEVLKQFLLKRTPTEVIMITFLLTSAYLVMQGIEVIARVSQLLVPLIIVPYSLFAVPTVTNMDFTNFLPFMRTPPLNILTGITTVITAYLGFETILLLQPFMNRPKYATRAVITGVSIVMVFYLAIVVINIAVFGTAEIKKLIWPALTLMRVVDIPGAFIQNIHGIIMAIWVVSIYSTLSVFYFCGVLVISRMVRTKEHKFFVLPMVPVIYMLGLVPDNIASTYDLIDAFSLYIGIPYGFVLPMLLYIIAKARGFKRGEVQQDGNTAGKNS